MWLVRQDGGGGPFTGAPRNLPRCAPTGERQSFLVFQSSDKRLIQTVRNPDAICYPKPLGKRTCANMVFHLCLGSGLNRARTQIPMPINPVQFAHSICDEFLRYIFSAFPITDPNLATRPARSSGARPPLTSDLWPQLFSDVSCIALWISSEKILTRLYSVLIGSQAT